MDSRNRSFFQPGDINGFNSCRIRTPLHKLQETYLREQKARERIGSRIMRLTGKHSHELLWNCVERRSHQDSKETVSGGGAQRRCASSFRMNMQRSRIAYTAAKFRPDVRSLRIYGRNVVPSEIEHSEDQAADITDVKSCVSATLTYIIDTNTDEVVSNEGDRVYNDVSDTSKNKESGTEKGSERRRTALLMREILCTIIEDICSDNSFDFRKRAMDDVITIEF